MQCQQCGYSLFNLTQPRCPECGTPFKVSDYQFASGTVHFACTHCGQQYQGNDPSGLPSPRQFACVHCRQAIDVDQMSVVPVVEDVSATMLRPGCDWERGTGARWGLFFPTVKQIMLTPSAFFRQVALDGNWAPVWWFAALVGWIQGAGNILQRFLESSLGMDAPMPPGGMAIMVPCVAVLAPLAVLIFGFVMSGILHVCLLLVGANRAGFWATYRVWSFGQAPGVLGIIPFAGGIVAFFWSVVVMVFGLKGTHEAATWQSVVAVLLMFVVAVALFVFIGIGCIALIA